MGLGQQQLLKFHNWYMSEWNKENFDKHPDVINMGNAEDATIDQLLYT